LEKALEIGLRRVATRRLSRTLTTLLHICTLFTHTLYTRTPQERSMSRGTAITTGLAIWLPAALSIQSSLTLPQPLIIKLGMLALLAIATLLFGLLVWNSLDQTRNQEGGQVRAFPTRPLGACSTTTEFRRAA